MLRMNVGDRAPEHRLGADRGTLRSRTTGGAATNPIRVTVRAGRATTRRRHRTRPADSTSPVGATGRSSASGNRSPSSHLNPMCRPKLAMASPVRGDDRRPGTGLLVKPRLSRRALALQAPGDAAYRGLAGHLELGFALALRDAHGERVVRIPRTALRARLLLRGALGLRQVERLVGGKRGGGHAGAQPDGGAAGGDRSAAEHPAKVAAGHGLGVGQRPLTPRGTPSSPPAR